MSAVACFFYLCGWAFVSRTRVPVARHVATSGSTRSASPATGRGTASFAALKRSGLRRANMMRNPEKPDEPQIDPKFFEEWVNYGMAEMHVFMVKHAQFDAWLLRHPKPTEEQEDGSTPAP